MQGKHLHLNNIKQGNMRVLYYLLSHPTSLHPDIISEEKKIHSSKVAASRVSGDSCLLLRLLEESFLNPVKWLQQKQNNVQDIGYRQ
jgi:hypothetical protein